MKPFESIRHRLSKGIHTSETDDAQETHTTLWKGLHDIVTRHHGLGHFFDRLRHHGLGHLASPRDDGDSTPEVSPEQAEAVIGEEQILALAEMTGMSAGIVSAHMADLLPHYVDSHASEDAEDDEPSAGAEPKTSDGAS